MTTKGRYILVGDNIGMGDCIFNTGTQDAFFDSPEDAIEAGVENLSGFACDYEEAKQVIVTYKLFKVKRIALSGRHPKFVKVLKDIKNDDKLIEEMDDE